MNKINISYMTDAAVETIRRNAKKVADNLAKKRIDSEWLSEIYSGDLYEVKKYKIPDFELLISEDGDYSKVDQINSITLYEALKELPRYVLTDERFWSWINFTKGYQASLQAIPIKGESTFRDHWLFTQGNRRGLFFGVMSRCYFRVDLTVDERLEDKYELTRFVIENPERFRNLTWRASSSNKHIVLGVLKAEKDICEKYKEQVKNDIYSEVAKFISLYGSVRLIDAVMEEDIYQVVYNKMEEIITKQIEEKKYAIEEEYIKV